ncbi:MAG: hypothetical protein C0483_11110 [Pirellula sp.]|nr:hypothetical protein [Pirellula sp.]
MTRAGRDLSAADFATGRHRKLRAPRADGGMLIDPARAKLPGVVARNIAGRNDWSFDAAGESVAAFAASARAEFVAEALAYTRAYRDVAEPTTASPLLLAGHQPEMFHPGVWAKNFALSGLAAATGAAAVNLVIDGDTLKAASLRVPTGTVDEPRVESVPFDAAHEEIPYEERRVADVGMFESFGARAVETLRPLLTGPLLESFWPEVVRQARETGTIGAAVARARHKLEGAWGLRTLELPQSRMCDTAHFRRFAGHLLRNLPRFMAAHNDELHGYRRRENIRSANHPVPELAQEGDWLEAPLWLWTADEPRRRHVFVRRIGGEIELTDRRGTTLRLPLADDRYDDFAAALEDASRRGIRLRSRALLTTMYARVVLGDLFLHGIGGGKYDELTDAIVRRYFGVDPPEFAVVTATRRLPIAVAASPKEADRKPHAEAAQVDEHAARHHLWELRHHPERFVDVAALRDETSRAAATAAVAEKVRWLATEPTQETARIRCHAIRSANEALQPFLAAERARWTNIQSASRDHARADELLGSREFSAFLFPEIDLRGFLLAIAAREG